MRTPPLLALLLTLFCTCGRAPEAESGKPPVAASPDLALLVLGNVQDAGSPHVACRKECCRALFDEPDPTRQVTALGVYDRSADKAFLFEASPDLPRQVKHLKRVARTSAELPAGIFLTHAHIGHYTGLMYLGKEATNADRVPVYAMPRMRNYLTNNGPWGQLVKTNNISLRRLTADSTIVLTANLRVTPFRVPHRDEYSETVGYRIEGPENSVLFVPDIDKWEKWDRAIEDEIARVDYAFLDGTFYDAAELNTRDISQIPHPFVSESLTRFADLPAAEKRKIHFIHFNHTNALLRAGSEQRAAVAKAGFGLADHGLTLGL